MRYDYRTLRECYCSSKICQAHVPGATFLKEFAEMIPIRLWAILPIKSGRAGYISFWICNVYEMGIIVGRISSWLLPFLSSTLKSYYYSLLIAVLLCSSDMMTTYLLGRQIHLKAIFDISMCHPKVPYHYTFIMTTSRKKSQKFTQTNSKRPSKVKEAGSCFMTERRVSELSHIFLTYYVAEL